MEKLDDVFVSIVADLKKDGHKMNSFLPAPPDVLDPAHTAPFVSKAVCEACRAWLIVQWDGRSFRVEGTVLSVDGCTPSLRQPAA